MARKKNVRHIVSGLEATLDVHAVTSCDVWVSVEDLPEALRQVKKLSDDSLYQPRVYAKRDGDRKVCLRFWE